MIGQSAPVMDQYGAQPMAQPMQGSIAAWIARHPMFQHRQHLTDPAQQPLPAGAHMGQHPGFTPGFNIGQLLMRLPNQGARFMQRPLEMQQSRYSY